MCGIVWGRGLCVLGISDIRGIQLQRIRPTYGANDEAKFGGFIVVEEVRGRHRPPHLGGANVVRVVTIHGNTVS